MGRLLMAVAQDPKNPGIGIDENTAIVVKNERFRVLGEGAVYVADGQDVTYSTLSEADTGGVISIFNVRLHTLGPAMEFDLVQRQPLLPTSEQETGEG